MLKKFKEVFQTKKLVLALGLAGVVAFFGGVYVSAQTEIDTEPVIAREVVTTDDETPTIETPEVTLVEEETPITETPSDPVTTPVVEPEVDATVTLAQAQIIAEAEHEGAVVKASKTKSIKSETVYAFYFNDNWKIYVRATDGSVVKVLDNSGKGHGFQNTYKQNKEKAAAVSTQGRRGDDNGRRDYGQSWDHRKDGDHRNNR